MAAFQGQLNVNKIYGAIYNQILAQEVNSKNISREYAKLLNMAKQEVGLFGDQKLFYETYSPKISKWRGDDEATELLSVKPYRVKSPECQAVTINVFQKVVLVLDKFLTKQAWMNEGAFATFNSVMLAWINDVVDMYEMNTYNAFFGSEESNVGKQQRQIDLTTAIGGKTGEEAEKLKAMAIAADEVKLFGELADNTPDFIDYGPNGMIRGFNAEDFVVVTRLSLAAELTKMGTPDIYHNDIFGKVTKLVLPDRWFTKLNTTEKKGDGKTIRSRIYQDLTGTDGVTYELKAGDLIPAVCTAPANTSVTEDATILYKVVAKDSIPWLSAFEAAGSMYNIQSLTDKYVTVIGHNTLEHLSGRPIITVRSK